MIIHPNYSNKLYLFMKNNITKNQIVFINSINKQYKVGFSRILRVSLDYSVRSSNPH